MERLAALRGLIEPDSRSPLQFSDHVPKNHYWEEPNHPHQGEFNKRHVRSFESVLLIAL